MFATLIKPTAYSERFGGCALPTFFFKRYGDHRDLHSFPTRRSSDLRRDRLGVGDPERRRAGRVAPGAQALADRKSTRLNSSHSQISYAVFCLKKKKNSWH